MTYIVVFGNPIDGFSYVGPFDNFDAAEEWCDDVDPDNWWITELESPATSYDIPQCDPQLQALLDEQDALDEAREVARKVKEAVDLLTNYGLSVTMKS